MNTFTAKKLGEVMAFSRIGTELVARGGEAASEAMGGQDATTEFVQKLNSFAHLAESSGDDATATKADATEGKLRGMMEAYIKDEWDNPVELLEWSSFYLGSAAAHWSLVLGAAKATNNAELETGASEAVDFYNDTLRAVQSSLHEFGEAKGATVE